MSSITYNAESIKRIEEARDTFAGITPRLDEAFETVVAVAEQTGMPKVSNAAKNLYEAYVGSFRKVNEQIVATCDEDARLWKALAVATGVE